MEVIGIIIFVAIIAAPLFSNKMKCRVCKEEISKNARFCPHCGEPYDD